MNNKKRTIIEFGFRIISRIMEIEDVIRRGLPSSTSYNFSDDTQPHWIFVKYDLKFLLFLQTFYFLYRYCNKRTIISII